MKGDFTRDTFRPSRHYQQVLRQQGRVGLDADINEQAAIDFRRDVTALVDLAGKCGGPADHAGFRIVTDPKTLSDAEYLALRNWVAEQVALNPQPLPPVAPLPASKAAAVLGEGDFILMPGRYYVDGIQCELEHPVLYRLQPDRLDVGPLAKAAAPQNHAVYLDVWSRHVTPLEDEGIREPALGGVDTSTRAKTVWQVRAVPFGALADSPCASGTVPPATDADPGTARVTAFTADPTPSKDPCLLPPEAGYTGLENQLYRVEVHDGTRWKWSRENGSVTAVIQQLIANEPGATGGAVIVDALGRDEHLSFREGDYVEILDDGLELEGRIAQVLRINRVDPSSRKLVLDAPVSLLATGATFPNGVNGARHPKVRRWEGLAKMADADTAAGAAVENGIRVRFEKKDELGATCVFKPGHFWLIPARAATANSPHGDIEWPRQAANQRLPLPPRGVLHRYCRLGVAQVAPAGAVTLLNDCRCLWPALTSVPQLFYLSGDGQEAVLDPVAPATATTRFRLPQPLIVGVANGHCADRPLFVRFEALVAGGQLARVGTAPGASPLDVPVGADGQAAAEFYPVGTTFSQRVQARLLDLMGQPVAPPILFNATLSTISLEAVGGDGQDAAAGSVLPLPIEVAVFGASGPIHGASLQFTPTAGSVAPAGPVTTNAQGRAQVTWTLGTTPMTQQLVVALAPLPGGSPHRGPSEVRFTANIRPNNVGGGKSCCVVVGRDGDFKQLADVFQDPEIRKQRDLCICLQAGEHVLGTSLEISPGAGQPFNVTLHGCGASSRLLLQEAPIRILGLANFTLRDLEIDTGTIAEPIQFLRTGRILIDGCRIQTDQLQTDLVTVATVESVEIRNSLLGSWLQFWGKPQDPFGFGAVAGIKLAAVPFPSNTAVFQRLGALATQVSRLNQGQLPALAAFLRNNQLASGVRGDVVKERFARAVDGISRALETGGFGNLGALLPDVVFGRALVVVGRPDRLTLAHSEFLGDVHLLGSGRGAEEGDMVKLIGSSSTGFDLAKRLVDPVGAWLLQDNDIYQLTLDRRSVPDNLSDEIRGHPEQLQFTGNTWRQGFVPFLAVQADLSHSQFLGRANPLAIGGGDVGVVTGNSVRAFELSILARFGTLEAGHNARIGVTS